MGDDIVNLSIQSKPSLQVRLGLTIKYDFPSPTTKVGVKKKELQGQMVVSCSSPR